MLALYIFLSTIVTIQAELEGFIVGGSLANIKSYPHSANLLISCHYGGDQKLHWRCGSSILNQRILLTAGHCLEACNTTTHIIANMGDAHRENGIIRSASGFIIHANYDTESLTNDIAMIKISKPLKFSARIGRVAIMDHPPYSEPANIAGWGHINEDHEKTLVLKELHQKVMKHTECKRLFSEILPRGTICATSRDQKDFAANGDSGAALVVRDYIQIGIASFKVPETAQNALIYTDVGFFYEWIIFNSHRLYCNI